MLIMPTMGSALLEQATVAPTTGGSASSKGSYSQVIAALSRDCHMMQVAFGTIGTSAGARDGLADIGVGAATEDLLVSNLVFGGAGGIVYWLPLFIPEGTRVAIRGANRGTSTAFTAVCNFFHWPGGPPFRTGTRVVSYGLTTVPNGTTISPGASGAEGSYTEITSATSEDHFAVLPGFQVTNDTTQNMRRLSIDIGAGAVTEDDIATDYLLTTTSDERAFGFFFPTFINIPSGTRLAMRASNSGTNDGGYDGMLYGFS